MVQLKKLKSLFVKTKKAKPNSQVNLYHFSRTDYVNATKRSIFNTKICANKKPISEFRYLSQ